MIPNYHYTNLKKTLQGTKICNKIFFEKNHFIHFWVKDPFKLILKVMNLVFKPINMYHLIKLTCKLKNLHTCMKMYKKIWLQM